MQFSKVFMAFILVATTGAFAFPTFRAENQEGLATAGAFADAYDYDLAATYGDLVGEDDDVYTADIADYTKDAGCGSLVSDVETAEDAEDAREVQLFSRALGRIVRHFSRHLLCRGLRTVSRGVRRGVSRGARRGFGKIGRKGRSSLGRRIVKKTVRRTFKRLSEEEERRRHRNGQSVACACCPRLGWIARDGEFGDDAAYGEVANNEAEYDEIAFDNAAFDDAQPQGVDADEFAANTETKFDQLD